MVGPARTTDIPKKNTANPNPVRLLLALVFVVLVQFVVCGQFSSRAMRVDVLLIAPIYLALTVSPVPAVFSSCIIGFLMDVVSGGFIGFHLFFYVFVTIFVFLVERKVSLSGTFQQLILLVLVWLFEGFLIQLSAFSRSGNLGEFCVFSRLFVYKTLTVLVLGLLILLVLPVISGFKIRKVTG